MNSLQMCAIVAAVAFAIQIPAALVVFLNTFDGSTVVRNVGIGVAVFADLVMWGAIAFGIYLALGHIGG